MLYLIVTGSVYDGLRFSAGVEAGYAVCIVQTRISGEALTVLVPGGVPMKLDTASSFLWRFFRSCCILREAKLTEISNGDDPLW